MFPGWPTDNCISILSHVWTLKRDVMKYYMYRCFILFVGPLHIWGNLRGRRHWILFKGMYTLIERVIHTWLSGSPYECARQTKKKLDEWGTLYEGPVVNKKHLASKNFLQSPSRGTLYEGPVVHKKYLTSKNFLQSPSPRENYTSAVSQCLWPSIPRPPWHPKFASNDVHIYTFEGFCKFSWIRWFRQIHVHPWAVHISKPLCTLWVSRPPGANAKRGIACFFYSRRCTICNCNRSDGFSPAGRLQSWYCVQWLHISYDTFFRCLQHSILEGM